MAFSNDVLDFKKYIYDKYGKQITIQEKRNASGEITDDDPRVDKWASAIAEYFNVDKSVLFSKGRKNNSYEKIWFRYMLVEEEAMTMHKIYKMLNLRQHSTLLHSINTCKDWAKAYPEVYAGIVECAKKHNLIKEGNIKIVYE
jgi:chromosomal replication initiation ATPase DnaA